MARTLAESLNPDATDREALSQAAEFCYAGQVLAEQLHNYGHQLSMQNPDWRAAGKWMRDAGGILASLSA